MHKWIFSLVLGVVAVPGWADAPGANRPAVSEETELQLREELRMMLARLAASGALGAHPEQILLDVDEPAQRVSDLGLLVDSTSAETARDGLRVIATTPGGNADRLGLRAGDRLIGINGHSLRNLGADEHGRALAARTLKTLVTALPDNAALQAEVQRGGSTFILSASLQSLRLPALHLRLGGGAPAAQTSAASAPAHEHSDACGRISTFDVAPRGEQLYAVRLLLLDGSTPGSNAQSTFRVSAGTHQLLIAENIPAQQIGAGDIAQLRRNTSKPLTVDVKPGTTLMLAAKLHREHATELMRGGYWDPVVWREVAEPCP